MKDMIDAICDIIEKGLTITPVIGALPPLGGVAIQASTGGVLAEYLPRTALHRTTLVVNAKDNQQGVALQNLVDIHTLLTKRIGYPSTDDWQIATIRTVTAPDFLGQENDEAYLYGSSIEVLWYDRVKADDTPL